MFIYSIISAFFEVEGIEHQIDLIITKKFYFVTKALTPQHSYNILLSICSHDK